MAILAASIVVLGLSILIFIVIKLIDPVYMEKGVKLLMLKLRQKDYDLLSDGMLLGIVFGIETMLFGSVSESMTAGGGVLLATAAAFFVLQLLSVFIPIIWILMPSKFLPERLRRKE